MRRYTVKVIRHTIIYVEVDATSEKEAKDIASNTADDGLISESYISDAIIDDVQDIEDEDEDEDL